MRLDKLLANTGIGSRKEVKVLLKKKRITVNDTVIRDGGKHINPTMDQIKVDGNTVHYKPNIYIMMHKPPGVISATEDKRQKTVIDLLTDEFQHYKPFPVGRLDKDTEGLLLLTNDGDLAHHLLSPKKKVDKVYYAKIKGRVTEQDHIKFSNGIQLEDGYMTMPANLNILQTDDISEVEITITEGKFHQVKRMFQAVNKEVIYLKRKQMGRLKLDDALRVGSYRELSKEELAYCLSLKK